MRIIRLETTTSTNSDARKLAENADFGPLWITAQQQIGGRGRNGRNWTSPKGNFYGSCLFPTQLPTQLKSLYSFVAALAVYDTLSEIYPDGDFRLKWPNDLLLNSAKIAGLLLETGQTHSQSWVIVGIGINLLSHPQDVSYPAISLSSVFESSLDPERTLAGLSENFEIWKTKFETQGFEPIRKVWLKRALNVPGRVTVRLPDETFSGDAIDLESDGALKVRLANCTIRQVHAGDVYPG